MEKTNTFVPAIRIPVGISNFREIREKDLYYVDKTGFIFELLNSTEKVRLITRPRRFGKTLMMSMLENFFNIEKDSAELFSGLEVNRYTQLCDSYLNKYPVIFLSFKEIEGNDFEAVCRKLKNKIYIVCKSYLFLLDSNKIDQDDKSLFAKLKTGMADEIELQDSLVLLSRLLFNYYNKQIIILIDEYDVPLAKAADNGYYKEMLGLMRGILQVLKDNDYLEFAVLTGCLRVSKESIFTGVNNFTTNSIVSKDFNQYFGFTESDVQKLLIDFQASEQYPVIKQWYDGYNFGGLDMYCPWDVTRYLADYMKNGKTEAACYWAGSSGNTIICSFISKYARFIKLDLEKLLRGEAVQKKISFNLTYGELQDSVENFWSVLLLSGYLTVEKDADFDKVTEDGGILAVKIPNEEIKQIFIETIDKWVENATGKLWNVSPLIEAIWKKDVSAMSSEITKILKKTISYFDYSESFYHAFLAGVLTGAGQFVSTNPETGEGRSDIVLENPDNDRVFIFELKRTKAESDMEKACLAALNQIQDKHYDDEYIDSYDEIVHYGVAFYKKRCLVKMEE